MHSIISDSIDSLRAEWESYLSTVEPGQIVVNNLPNRFGKTYSTLKYLSITPGRYLYLSDRHNQMEEVADWDKAVHWYGLSELCERKDDPFISALINRKLGGSIICRYFCGKKSCSYKKQFQIKNDVIVVAPKEYFPTKYVQDKSWDYVILDEHLEKAQKITCTHPKIPEGTLKKHEINSRFYYALKYMIDGSSHYTEDKIPELVEWSKLASSSLPRVIKSIKEKNNEFRPNGAEENLIKYLKNLPETVEWTKNFIKYGPLEHYFKPYLHYAFDLQKEHNSRLIILNTSYDQWVYDQLANQYTPKLPEPSLYSLPPMTNKDSFLLHYHYKKRSLSKKTFLKNGRNFKGKLGNEIHDMLRRTINFSHKRNLKIGVITYKSLKEKLINLFGDRIDVISHFGGHQGSNQFDDVDVLIILGTYHLNSKGLYQKHLIITNEFLAHNPAVWGGKNNLIINGMQISGTDNKQLNKVKLYKLNEEHQQAIFRSGAHIHPGKLVISFGFVPGGIEENLTYHKFATSGQLIARLNTLKDKIGS